jgi:hypothetical protein
MQTENERFSDDVDACANELTEVLSRLAVRYSDLVVVAAMAEHIGGGLRVLTHRGLCTEEQARQVLQQVEDAVNLYRTNL